jgi:hypothetical protein
VHVVSLSSFAASPPGAPLPDPKDLAKQLAKRSSVANGRPIVLEIDYLVKGLLTRNEVSVLYGPSNCGKSTFVTTMGMDIIQGRPFAGMNTRRAAVLHIAPEGATSVHAATIPYIGEGQSVDADRYIVLPLRLDLRNKLHAETLVELVRCLEATFDCDIGLIVIHPRAEHW